MTKRMTIALAILGVFSVCLPVVGQLWDGNGVEGDPYLIYTPEDMNSIGLDPNSWDAHFKLMANIDLSAYTGTSFNMIGTSGNPFTGTFNGNGHEISNFTYYLFPGWVEDVVGLFLYVNGENALIKNLGLVSPKLNLGKCTGSLVAKLENGTVCTCYVRGGSIEEGGGGLGGLVGWNDGQISNCYSSLVEVIGHASSAWPADFAGGLVGKNHGSITNCYSTSSVSGNDYLGGLVGNNYGSISNSFATGRVKGNYPHDHIGGLVGKNDDGDISNCYATGSVTGNAYIGGLVGWNANGTVSHCYAAGSVMGNDYTGGMVGYQGSGDYTSCFWDSTVNPDVNGIGNGSDPNVIGESTANMQTQSTFTNAGWDFVGEAANGTDDIWRMCVDDVNYPMLWWEFIDGDFVCPDGVDGYDLAVLCEQWLFEELPADVAPEGGDGVVNFLDWAIFAAGWQITEDYESLAVFAEQWLKTGANYLIADIAPAPAGDEIVNWLDFAVLAEEWLN